MINQYIEKLDRITNYHNRSGMVRLDMNENPAGLPVEFVNNVLKEITPEFLSTYPNCYNFINKYSEYAQLNVHNVLPTNGSDMAIRLIFDTFVSEGSIVLGVSPSFEMYRINAEMHGAKYLGIRYNSDFSFDYDHFLDAISQDVSLISLLNPNNPIGDVFPRSFVIDVIEKAQKNNSIVLIDEAYYYYNKNTFIDLIEEFDNVIFVCENRVF